MNWRVHCGDIRKFCARYDGPPHHACLTDPPYHLTSKRGGGKGFMNAAWDGGDIAFRAETWAALAKHLLPGAFGMTFAGSRGWHRVACAIEDAGLRLHPTIFCWAFGSGFPKASRIGKVAREPEPDKGTVDAGEWANVLPELQKRAEEERQAIREKARQGDPFASTFAGHRYGLQALKPAVEPIIVWQVPYEGKPVDSIVKHGAGALNIEAGRIGYELGGDKASNPSLREKIAGGCGGHVIRTEEKRTYMIPSSGGRWPANFLVSHFPDCRRVGTKKVKSGNSKTPSDSTGVTYQRKQKEVGPHYADADGLETVEEWHCVESCPVRKLDEQSGERLVSGCAKSGKASDAKSSGMFGKRQQGALHNDSGGASRFFFNSDWNAEVEEGILFADPVRYQAKAGRKERDAGLDSECQRRSTDYGAMKKRRCRVCGCRTAEPGAGGKWPACGHDDWEWVEQKPVGTKGGNARNPHPTIKPIKLCTWLAKLLLPPDAYAPRRILVPFAGAGSEMIAAGLAGWDEVVGIEREAEYAEIARARLRHWLTDADEKEGEE